MEVCLIINFFIVGSWIQVDLTSATVIYRIVTQGRNGYGGRLTTYKVKHGNVPDNLHFIQENGADRV